MMFRVRPNLSTLPTQQHPETALLASATPSPMTPSEEKLPGLEILDQVNNNKKYQIRETNLPKLSQAVLSPTSTPRSNKAENKENDSGEDSGKYSHYSKSSVVSMQRNLTRTVAVCSKPNPELVQCRKCGKVKCVQPNHNHQQVARTRIKTNIKK